LTGNKRKAIVFGATGYVGRYVVEEWQKRGFDCVAHIRPDSVRLADWQERFGSIGASCDLAQWNIADLARSLGVLLPSHLFCLIGTTRKRMSDIQKSGGDVETQTYEAVDYGMTRMLVDACQKAGIQPRFIYLSAIGTGPNASGAYMKARYKAEMAVRESGLPFVVAKPPIITGVDRDEERLAEHMAGKALDGLLFFAGAIGFKKAQARWSSFSGQALACALVESALRDPGDREIILESEQLRALYQK
jgi:uncharacterized protein YbjT (DUF2867 family)